MTLATHATELMSSKLDENSPTERLHLMVPRSLLSRVNKWRGRQDPIPTQSAAIRMLLERALEIVEDEAEAERDAPAKDGK